MDDHNVHHFWGISPPVDLLNVLCNTRKNRDQEECHLVQVSPYDFRHTLETISKARRHPANGKVHLYVYEDHAEGLARHMLLLAVMLDGELTARERMELVLELHGNALIRDKAADYLDSLSRKLEEIVVGSSSKQAAGGGGAQQLSQLFDLSLLRYQERDDLADALRKCRKTVSYDMVKAWDTRSRHWYQERYDVRINMIDWDYQMRLAEQAKPKQAEALGSIIHFQHFREWRLHGIAHELRDCVYNQPNRSLLSTATGRTKEFKDRTGRDVGRSVTAWGYWGDVLNPPYHSLGTACEEPAFFKVANKQYTRTAVDIAQHNITALLHELRTGERYMLPGGGEASRAAAARGPTSLEELEAEGAQAAAAAAAAADSSSAPEQQGSTADAAAQASSSNSTSTDPAPSSSTAPQAAEAASSHACSSSMQEAEQQLRAAEAQLDAAAWRHLQRFTIHLLTGDFTKAVSGRAKYAGKFDVASVGHRHMHLLGSEHKLAAVLKPGAVVVAESGVHMVQLKKEQAEAFAGKVSELAVASGLTRAEEMAGVDAAHMVFVSKGAA